MIQHTIQNHVNKYYYAAKNSAIDVQICVVHFHIYKIVYQMGNSNIL